MIILCIVEKCFSVSLVLFFSYTESESNRLSLEETLSNVSQQMTAVELKK